MNPQLENGYLKLANELQLAFIQFRIPGELRQIVDCVIYKTYGFNKKEDWIAQSQIIKLTKKRKGNISRGLSKLITHKIVIKTDNKMRLNKNYQEWVSFGKLSKEITNKKLSKLITKVIRTDNSKLSSMRVTKDNITKDNIHKTIKATAVADDLNSLIKLFETVNPNYNRLYANKTQRAALQRQVDKFTYEKIKNLLNQLPEIVVKPYAPRITTPLELEISMGKLIIFLKQENLDRKEVIDARGI